jgi:acyl-CoA reductase-like NAD-dependent aldehyde dehydrogenase
MPLLTVDNPATELEELSVDAAGSADVHAALAHSHAAAQEVATMPIAERIALCDRFVDAFAAQAEPIATDVTRQMGKPIAEARGEVRTMLDRARYMISIAEQELTPQQLNQLPGFERTIERVPVGVVLDIAAWNYPLLIPVNVCVPAVLAGNAAMIKHSSRTPLCAGHFENAFETAGAPPGTVQGLVTDHATTAELISDERVGYVSFTGSVEGGREISRAAAGRFIDVGLELGGKDAAYVRADCDLEHAAANIAEGGFYNAGQSCCGVERVYVDQAIYGEFLEALLDHASVWQPGRPTDKTTTLGPMAQASAPRTIAAQVDDAVGRGARVLCGGNTTQVGGRGRYFEATVVADADHSMRIMTDETFGPVLAVAAVSSDDEAVAKINDSAYGLTASIWSRDPAASRAIGGRLEVGTVFLNRCDYLDPALPWSGWKDSGVGVTLSHLGFARMTRTRAFHFRLPSG